MVIKRLEPCQLVLIGRLTTDKRCDCDSIYGPVFCCGQNVRSHRLTSHALHSQDLLQGNGLFDGGPLVCRSSILTTWNPQSLTFPCFFLHVCDLFDLTLQASIPNFDRQVGVRYHFVWPILAPCWQPQAGNPSCKSSPQIPADLWRDFGRFWNFLRQIPWAKNQKLLAAWEHGRTCETASCDAAINVSKDHWVLCTESSTTTILAGKYFLQYLPFQDRLPLHWCGHEAAE